MLNGQLMSNISDHASVNSILSSKLQMISLQ